MPVPRRVGRFELSDDDPFTPSPPLEDRGWWPHPDRLKKERIDVDDLLSAARQGYDIRRLDQVEDAILETSGGVGILPRSR